MAVPSPEASEIKQNFNSSQSPVLTVSDKFKIISDDTEQNMLHRLSESPLQPEKTQERKPFKLVVEESATAKHLNAKPALQMPI